jgi:carboxymethylenebutenolidase
MPDITIKGPDGAFSAYVARPDATGKAPAVVVIQEIFGVNQVMRDICDAYAKEGYVAICPDLFWRQEPGIQITDRTEAEWQKAFQLYQGFDEAKGVEDLKATIAHIRGDGGTTGKVGSVGYCLGGKLAYLTATRTDIDAAVGYYGVGIENALDEASNISRPLMLHIAKDDGFCPKEAQAKIHEALDGHANVTIHDYLGCDHAFARMGGEHYDAEAAGKANQRAADFFQSHLA